MSKGQISGLLSPFLERIRNKNILPYIHGMSVLDCGAGRGYLSTLLPKRVRYVGIEVDPAIERMPQAVILIGDIAKGVPIHETFDHIVLNEMIEHLKNPDEVFTLLKDHLTDQGTIIVSVSIPLRYKFHGIASKLGLASREAEEEHTYFPGKKELYRLAHATRYCIKEFHRKELWTKQIAIFKKEK